MATTVYLSHHKHVHDVGDDLIISTVQVQSERGCVGLWFALDSVDASWRKAVEVAAVVGAVLVIEGTIS